jgi:hypothetical protein
MQETMRSLKKNDRWLIIFVQIATKRYLCSEKKHIHLADYYEARKFLHNACIAGNNDSLHVG